MAARWTVLLLATLVALSDAFQCPLFGGITLKPATSVADVLPPGCDKLCVDKSKALSTWPDLPDVDTASSDEDKLRAYFVNVARCFLGTVATCGGSKGQLFGAETLFKIFKTSVTPFNDGAKNDIMTGKKWKGKDWCGIYSTAALRLAGESCSKMSPVPSWCNPKIEKVHWFSGAGIQNLGPQIPVFRGNIKPKCKIAVPGMQVGDIVAFKGPLQHQSVVWKINSDSVITMDGNQYCQGIYANQRSLCEIQGYYSLSQLGQPMKPASCTWPKEGQMNCPASPQFRTLREIHMILDA